MSDKSELCTACGHFRPDGRVVDTGDGDGMLFTCPDCEARSRNQVGHGGKHEVLHSP